MIGLTVLLNSTIRAENLKSPLVLPRHCRVIVLPPLQRFR